VAFTGQKITYSFPVTSVIKSSPGTVTVTGLATNGDLDRDYQRVDVTWARSALAEWLAEGGTLRQQHDPRKPIGKGVGIGPDGLTVTSVVVAKSARKLTLARVLRSYSVGISGPTIVRDASAPAGKITGGSIVELSLCDTPSNPSCGVVIAKAAPDGRPVFVGRAFVTKGGADGVCLACGGPLKSKWKHCPRCGAVSPMFNSKEDAVKKKQRRALKVLAEQDRVRALTKAAGSPYPVYSVAEAIRADLIRDLDNPLGATRLAAADALRRLRA
jgi:hypothetical protein